MTTRFAACACALTHDEHTYEGWCGRWHYDKYGVVIYDAERDNSKEVGAVTLSNSETVERIPPTDPIEEVRIAGLPK